MTVTRTHMLPSLPADPHSAPHCLLLQPPAPPCSHFTALAIHGGKKMLFLPTQGLCKCPLLLPGKLFSHPSVTKLMPLTLASYFFSQGLVKTVSLHFGALISIVLGDNLILSPVMHLFHEIRNHSTAYHYIPRVPGT